MPLTFTENEHVSLIARAAPERVTVDEPATAVIVPPPQLPVNAFGVETTRPNGKASKNPIPVSVCPPCVLARLKVRDVDVVAPPNEPNIGR